MLAVQVGNEMLGALGQIEYCLEIDDFGACRAYVGKRLSQELEYAAVVLYILGSDILGVKE